MDAERRKLVERLKELCPHRKALAILLRKDIAGLRRSIVGLEEVRDEVRKYGHVHATGIGPRVVDFSPR